MKSMTSRFRLIRATTRRSDATTRNPRLGLGIHVENEKDIMILIKEKKRGEERHDGYYVAYKPITRSCILFMFIEIIFIHCHSSVMFAINSMSMCND